MVVKKKTIPRDCPFSFKNSNSPLLTIINKLIVSKKILIRPIENAINIGVTKKIATIKAPNSLYVKPALRIGSSWKIFIFKV